MIVREYTDGDFAEIKRLHELSGFGYELPASLSGQGFVSHRVIEDEQGIAMACFLRRTAEAYLIKDPAWRTPAWRMEAFRQLHLTCVGDAKAEHVQDIVAFLPPTVTKSFGRRLDKLGWATYRQEMWKPYSYPVE